MTQSNWLIPFNQRAYSGTFNCNFLWQWQNVYVMDNHRLALWCWLRHLTPDNKVDILHMDEHYDCLMSRHEEWVAALPRDIGSLSLEEYLKFSWQGHSETCPLFRFDNYFSLFMERYKDKIGNVYISTHRDGDRPTFEFHEFSILESMSYLNTRCSRINHNKAIVNIDIDYFTETGFDDPFRIVSNKFLQELGGILGKGLQNGSIQCFTVALSPEFTGSWEIAEYIAGEIFRAADVPFSLPKENMPTSGLT